MIRLITRSILAILLSLCVFVSTSEAAATETVSLNRSLTIPMQQWVALKETHQVLVLSLENSKMEIEKLKLDSKEVSQKLETAETLLNECRAELQTSNVMLSKLECKLEESRELLTQLTKQIADEREQYEKEIRKQKVQKIIACIALAIVISHK